MVLIPRVRVSALKVSNLMKMSSTGGLHLRTGHDPDAWRRKPGGGLYSDTEIRRSMSRQQERKGLPMSARVEHLVDRLGWPLSLFFLLCFLILVMVLIAWLFLATHHGFLGPLMPGGHGMLHTGFGT